MTNSPRCTNTKKSNQKLYLAKSLGASRILVMIRYACCSSVINAGGRRPWIPRYWRSSRRNAIPWSSKFDYNFTKLQCSSKLISETRPSTPEREFQLKKKRTQIIKSIFNWVVYLVQWFRQDPKIGQNWATNLVQAGRLEQFDSLLVGRDSLGTVLLIELHRLLILRVGQVGANSERGGSVQRTGTEMREHGWMFET